ncbi:hypothetical protein KY335_05685 [Candidatus Woesearchaeota archaeon]|nr:hypothetical protein [Candidatus Woesearchaeota archaeon]
MAYKSDLLCEVENVNLYQEGKEWAVIVTYKNPSKKLGVYKKKQIIIPANDEKAAKAIFAQFPAGTAFTLSVKIG